MTDILVVDFETFYDRAFSLSKVTTEEYLRDPRFEVIGVSVKRNSEPARWFSGTKQQIKKFLDSFNWSESVAVAHNAMFDMSILSWHFDIRPKRIVDTLSMARALEEPGAGLSLAKLAERYGIGAKGHEVLNALGKRRLDFTPDELARYGEYCDNDVELTYKLFERMMPLMPKLELGLIDLTIRMFSEPVLELDKGLLVKHLEDVRERKADLLNKALVHKDDLMSNDKLAKVLQNCGIVPPTKISARTGKLAWAFGKTDKEFTDMQEHPNPVVQAIVTARLGVKSTLEESRTERFIGIADRGTLPVPLRYYAAHTGRWGGDDKVNLQNLPSRGANAIKKSIKAPEGYVFIDCDSSQIEARTLAWLAGQEDLVEFFDKNNAEIAAGVKKKDMHYDPYKIMASGIYGVPVMDVTDPQRFVGKTTILGAGYGMGADKFQAQLQGFGVAMDLQECRRIISVYRSAYPRIPHLWQEGNRALQGMMRQQRVEFGREGVLDINLMGIKLPNGLYVRYPNLREQAVLGSHYREMVYDVKKGRVTIPTRIYGGKMTENVCQALARIIIGEQMLMISRRYKVVMTVHDAVGVLAKEGEAGAARAFVEQCMRMRSKWTVGLPLNCESKMGATYG